MKRKHDLTACLPFPDPQPAAHAVRPPLARRARRPERAPLELARLELADLRVHGSPLWRVQGDALAGLALDGGGDPADLSPDAPSGVGAAAGTWPARFAPGRSCARAVRQSDQCAFYLDLVGAVLIMALVVLAAILV